MIPLIARHNAACIPHAYHVLYWCEWGGCTRTLVPMSFVIPCRTITLHPISSLTNSTRRHKIHLRLYEYGPGVQYVTCSSCRLVYICPRFSTCAKCALSPVKISTDMFCSASIKISKRWNICMSWDAPLTLRKGSERNKQTKIHEQTNKHTNKNQHHQQQQWHERQNIYIYMCVCVCVCVCACTCGHKLLIFKQQQKTSKLTNKRRKRSPVSFAFARNYVSYTVKSQYHACGSAAAKYTQRTCIFCTDMGTVLVKLYSIWSCVVVVLFVINSCCSLVMLCVCNCFFVSLFR